MKSQKGITLISVTVYVIVMSLIVGVIATITSFFYNNVITVKDSSQNVSEYNKFNSYFLEETKQENNGIEQFSETYVVFKNGNKYTYQDKGIYKNNVKICKDIEEATFDVQYNKDKTIINVFIQIGTNGEFAKTTSYTISK